MEPPRAPAKRPARARRAAWLAALLLAGAAPAPADSDGERAALARLVGEIEALEPLVAEAERQADPKERRRFGYDWFRQDLEAVKAGLREHLERPREPRPPAGLHGR